MLVAKILRIVGQAINQIADLLDREFIEKEFHSGELAVPPVVEQPAAVPPVVEQPAAVPPVVEQPAAVPPVVEQPAAVPPVVEQPAAVEVDAEGLPWDHRIHSGSKNKNADKTWRLKKGVDKGLVIDVKAELKAAMSAPAAVPTVVEQPVAVPPVIEQPAAVDETDPWDTQAPVSLAGLVSILNKKMIGGMVTADQVTAACQKFGVQALPLLSARPDLIPQVFEELKPLWLTQG